MGYERTQKILFADIFLGIGRGRKQFRSWKLSGWILEWSETRGGGLIEDTKPEGLNLIKGVYNEEPERDENIETFAEILEHEKRM